MLPAGNLKTDVETVTISLLALCFIFKKSPNGNLWVYSAYFKESSFGVNINRTLFDVAEPNILPGFLTKL